MPQHMIVTRIRRELPDMPEANSTRLLELLTQAGRLLLEYNESAGEIHRALEATATSLSAEDFKISVTYGGIAVALGREAPTFSPVRELRFNTALQARVHATLQQASSGEIAVDDASARLQRVE